MTGSGDQLTSGTDTKTKPLQRADEAAELLTAVQQLVTSFIRSADEAFPPRSPSQSGQQQQRDKIDNDESDDNTRSALLTHYPPQQLQSSLPLTLPTAGLGKPVFIAAVQSILHHSVNTWHPSFLDKLYSSPTPVGLAADLLLSALNTNVHVYQVSPALTLIEKTTCKALAKLFGLEGKWAGGVSQPGGSAANLMSLVVARNVLFPEIKREGVGARGKLVVFTSEHGHYSVEKAAQICGLGSEAVRSVGVDGEGRMDPQRLQDAIDHSLKQGETPFYVNATAGTTVLGSFDPIDRIADVCEKYGLWLHVDGSWGGSVVFNEDLKKQKLHGIERADTITMCAHKMLNVPLPCSFLLGKDLRTFHQAMTLPAGYLFHGGGGEDDNNPEEPTLASKPTTPDDNNNDEDTFYDLADLTPQCGRRGDALKLFLSWLYHGRTGLSDALAHAFSVAAHLASLLLASPSFTLVSAAPPPCLQVCFYLHKSAGGGAAAVAKEENTRITETVCARLMRRGEFMVDYAPGAGGKFFRVVVNCQTRRETVEGLVRRIAEVGGEVVDEMKLK